MFCIILTPPLSTRNHVFCFSPETVTSRQNHSTAEPPNSQGVSASDSDFAVAISFRSEAVPLLIRINYSGPVTIAARQAHRLDLGHNAAGLVQSTAGPLLQTLLLKAPGEKSKCRATCDDEEDAPVAVSDPWR